jgi:23S rRNA (uridine2552-2'-O)-methyltransferase
MSWIHKHINDPYVKLSKQKGYISRAYFKIEEINTKFNIINKHAYVLDLGACPGGWTQYAMKYTHHITAIDLHDNWRITNIPLLQCDIFDLKLDKKFEIILSDIACDISGNNDIDAPAMDSIVYCLLDVVQNYLRPNGNFVCKLFTYNQHIFRNLKLFTNQWFYKPKSSRSDSAEIYFVGKGYNPKN